MIPGSHRLGTMSHEDKPGPENMLSRGQHASIRPEEDDTVELNLHKGQMSLHNLGIAHSSSPNKSAKRRIGFTIRYFAPHVKQVIRKFDSTTLVKGRDDFNHFIKEPIPSYNHEHEGNEFRKEMCNNATEYSLKDF